MSTEAIRRIEEIRARAIFVLDDADVQNDVNKLCRAFGVALDAINDIGDGCPTCNEAIRQIEEVLK